MCIELDCQVQSKEAMDMNSAKLKEISRQLLGKVKKLWSKINNYGRVEKDREIIDLSHKIQKYYGISREVALTEVEVWMKKMTL